MINLNPFVFQIGAFAVNHTRDLLAEIGFEQERLRMVNVSAAMARPLSEIITDMINTVRKLGPNPLMAPRRKETGQKDHTLETLS